MKIHRMLPLLLLIFVLTVKGQNKDYARNILVKLSSENLHGRGYVKNGNRRAARFIRKEFKMTGIKSLDSTYFQKFSIDINTFPEKQQVRIGEKNLQAGNEFLIRRSSPSAKGTFDLFWLNTEKGNTDSLMRVAAGHDLSGKYLVTANQNREWQEKNPFGAAGLVVLKDKLWWGASSGQRMSETPVISVLHKAIDTTATQIYADINARFHKNYQTQNVIGYLPGSSNPEQYFFITAHYDHVGRMGDVMFPGGNDNASGVAMMLDLARYFTKHRPEFSIVFIAFGAEETGLQGSRYFSMNMPVAPEEVMFAVNLDMVGTGSEGIKVVNGAVLHEPFQKLVQINQENNYLKKVGKRGEAANSDHYFLYIQGIPAFFIYTLGDEYREYHNPADKGADVPLTEYEDLFRLVKDFIAEFPLSNTKPE